MLSQTPKRKERSLTEKELVVIYEDTDKSIKRVFEIYEKKLIKSFEALGRTMAENRFDTTMSAVEDAIAEVKVVKAQLYVIEEVLEAVDDRAKNLLKDFKDANKAD